MCIRDSSTAASRLEAAIAEADRAWGAYRAAQERAEAAAAAVPGTGRLSGFADEAGVSSSGKEQADSAFDKAADSPESGGGAARAHADASARRDAARARVDELLGVEREARADRARWEARRDALSQLLTPEDGSAELLGRDGVLGQVAPLLRVAPGYEDAVASALAPFADAVVVDSLARGLRELDAAHAAGRSLRLVVAPPAPASDADEPADTQASSPERPGSAAVPADVGDLPEGATWLGSVVTCEGAAAPLADLLDGVVVCSPERAAEALDVPGVRAVVTPGGDVLRSWSLEGGHQASSVLSVRADFDEADARAREAGARMDAVSKQLADVYKRQPPS